MVFVDDCVPHLIPAPGLSGEFVADTWRPVRARPLVGRAALISITFRVRYALTKTGGLDSVVDDAAATKHLRRADFGAYKFRVAVDWSSSGREVTALDDQVRHAEDAKVG